MDDTPPELFVHESTWMRVLPIIPPESHSIPGSIRHEATPTGRDDEHDLVHVLLLLLG